MSTAMRTVPLQTHRAPFSADLLHWAAARPALTCIGLTLVYLLTVAALVAVLSAAALATPIGIAVAVVFAMEVIAFTAIGIYTVRP
jgi:hypothetical protein